LVHENVCMITIARQQSDIFQQYHSEKHLSEFYPQDGGESQLASKLRHYHLIDIELGLICVYVAKGFTYLNRTHLLLPPT